MTEVNRQSVIKSLEAHELQTLQLKDLIVSHLEGNLPVRAVKALEELSRSLEELRLFTVKHDLLRNDPNPVPGCQAVVSACFNHLYDGVNVVRAWELVTTKLQDKLQSCYQALRGAVLTPLVYRVNCLGEDARLPTPTDADAETPT